MDSSPLFEGLMGPLSMALSSPLAHQTLLSIVVSCHSAEPVIAAKLTSLPGSYFVAGVDSTVLANCFSSLKVLGTRYLSIQMGEERDAFYVVRKGDVIGIYKSLNDCQAEAGPSVGNPSMSVYKGYCLPKEAEDYLVSHGLKNASYTISANGVEHDLFGELIACPFQEPASSRVKAAGSPSKRLLEVHDSENSTIGSSLYSTVSQKRHFKSNSSIESGARDISSISHFCVLEFDGASKGNPGLSGAGAVLRAEDGHIVCCLQEGVGIATNNVAEYRAVILGLKHALKEGFKHIRVRGDSNLVCMQIQGLWKTKNQNMADLCKQAKKLKEKFISFEINHIAREFNSDADAQANQATNLRDGQVVVDRKKL